MDGDLVPENRSDLQLSHTPLTLELPAGSPAGARYQAVVRQLSDYGTLGQEAGTAALAQVRPSLRRVIGFEGFVLRTDHGAEKQFRSREDRLAELARWAWQARIRTTVFAEDHEPYIAIRLDMHAR